MKKLLLPLLLATSFVSAAEPLLPDATETPRMKDWREMKYGMFLHFGMSTFTGKELDPGDQPSTTYAPVAIDADQWMRVAKEAGMKYAVLTSKHVAGHCLWDSKVRFRGKEFDYDVATSGNKTDVIGKDWFWTAGDKARPTDTLFQLYDGATKAGGSLLLDAGPDRSGKLTDWQIEALRKLKEKIDGKP